MRTHTVFNIEFSYSRQHKARSHRYLSRSRANQPSSSSLMFTPFILEYDFVGPKTSRIGGFVRLNGSTCVRDRGIGCNCACVVRTMPHRVGPHGVISAGDKVDQPRNSKGLSRSSTGTPDFLLGTGFKIFDLMFAFGPG